MFWKKKGIPTGPTSVPSFVGVRVVAEMQKLPHTSDHWVKMKAVMRPKPGGNPNVFDIRIYDEWYIEERKLKVIDYTFFDSYPDLVQYEGWFDRSTKKAQIKAIKPA